MQEYSRTQGRRQRRKKGPSGAAIGAALAVLAVAALIVGGSVWWWIGSRTRPSAVAQTASPSSSAVSQVPSATTGTQTKSVSPSDTPAASSTDASSTASPETLAAARASIGADKKAAVRFPGAPAIKSNTPSVNHLNPRHKYIAITLDDGYNFQPKMLELFQQYDVHCTTFLVGSWAASHIEDLKLMKAAGFEIANHSWTHPFLTKLSSNQVASELTKTQRVISSVTGVQAPYLRPPFGDTNSSVKATAASLGMRIVMWDRTFGDSGRGATPQKLYSNVMSSGGGVKPGDIILCHWGSKPSYEALKRILPELQAQGYQFVTVSELIADSK
jgi:peptidoglycan/xylan/chitin deacetylase (PgdA/CDA1 family)